MNSNKKVTLFILFCVLAAIVGGIGGYYSGKLFSYINNGPLTIGVITIGVFAEMLSVTLHELAHLIAFKVQGLKINAFLLGPITFVRSGNSFKISFKYNKILGFGGMVMPVIPVVKNDADLTKSQKIYRNAIIAAPMVSIIVGCISIIFAILAFLLNNSMRAYILVFTFWMVLIAIIITISSFIKTPLVYGDFPASKEMKTNKLFAASQMYSYLYFMENSIERRKSEQYLKKIVNTELNQKVEFIDSVCKDIIVIDALNTILMESLVGMDKEPDFLKQYLEYFISNPSVLTEKSTSENHKILFVHILFWLKKNNDDRLNDLIDLTKNLFPSNEIQKYYDTQIAQLIFGENHTEYLSQNKNIKNSSSWSLYRIFDGYYSDEKVLNSKEFCL